MPILKSVKSYIALFMILIFLIFPQSHANQFDARVLRVIDGDTIEARVTLWPGLTQQTLIRLEGIDTPELRGKCLRERESAREAKRTVEGIVSQAKGRVSVSGVKRDKYGGRVVARVSTDQGDVSSKLVKLGLARRYNGGKKAGWCN